MDGDDFSEFEVKNGNFLCRTTKFEELLITYSQEETEILWMK